MGGMVPIYWHAPAPNGARQILNNGTLTIVRTDHRLFAVTAFHVIEGYFDAKKLNPQVICQVGNLEIEPQIIAFSGNRDDTDDNDGHHDLCTIEITEGQVRELGKVPLPLHDTLDVQEGRGIMLGGFPGAWRQEQRHQTMEFGALRVLGIARRVTETQITWVPDRDHPEHQVEVAGLPELPPNADLGGISGGPLVAFFETPGALFYYRLAGIVVQADRTLENVVARRSHLLRSNGTIRQR